MDPNRKQTEELLAGFDRTGRTPKTPPVTKDFVDFHQQRPERIASTPRVAKATFVIPRKRAVPAAVVWGVATVLMLGAGALVAWLAMPRSVPPPPMRFNALPSGTASAAPVEPALPSPTDSAPVPSVSATAAPSVRPAPRPSAPGSGFVRSM